MKAKNLHIYIISLLLLISIYLINFWVIDDAYITIRVLENFINGHGLVYNQGYKVQAFTSPLWSFLLLIFYSFIKNPFYCIFTTSTILMIIFLKYEYKILKKDKINVALCLICLALSKTFIDFSSSGLENILSASLTIYFIYKYTRERTNIYQLCFIASLIALNRLDNIIYITPAMLYLLYENKKHLNYKFIIISFSPIIMWEIFSLLYYGFLFPNTAYAKLFNSPLAFYQIISLGLDYFYFTIKTDPLLFLFFISSLYLTIKTKDKKNFFLLSGSFLYILYVLFSSGAANHIGNRFFYLANIISIIIFFLKYHSCKKIITILIIAISIINPFSPYKILSKYYGIKKYNHIFENGADKEYYYDQNYKGRLAKSGSYLVPNISKNKYSNSLWYKQGLKAKNNQDKIAIKGAIGFFGYGLGIEKHLIDILGLSDAFISRLPTCDAIILRPGHILRDIPSGYFETISSKKNKIKNKELRLYFEQINKITSNKIFSKERLWAIYDINIGKYDYLLKKSCTSKKQISPFFKKMKLKTGL